MIQKLQDTHKCEYRIELNLCSIDFISYRCIPVIDGITRPIKVFEFVPSLFTRILFYLWSTQTETDRNTFVVLFCVFLLDNPSHLFASYQNLIWLLFVLREVVELGLEIGNSVSCSDLLEVTSMCRKGLYLKLKFFTLFVIQKRLQLTFLTLMQTWSYYK